MSAAAPAPYFPCGCLLVAAPERLDDACFSIPAVRALARVDGLGRLVVLCPARQRPLWQTVPEVEVLTYPDHAGPRAIARTLGAAAGPDTAALAWHRSSASRAFRLAGITRRIGPADRATAADLTDRVEVVARPPGPVEHRVRDFLLLAEALGAGPFTAAHFAPVAAAAAPPPRSLAVVPDSDFGSSHAWPAARWCDVLAGWSGQGNLRPTIIDRGDGPVAAELAAALGGSAVCERTQSLADDLILLGRHRFVAAVDGTAPHLAAHLGATCLVLFGPNDPAWRRPLGKRHLVVRRHVECAPCLRPQCPLDHRCMHELGAAQVLDALTNLPGWQAAEDQAGAG